MITSNVVYAAHGVKQTHFMLHKFTHSSITLTNNPESTKAQSRPCPFCDRSVQDLGRHLITTHNERVKANIDDESIGRITKHQRIHAFHQRRKPFNRKTGVFLWKRAMACIENVGDKVMWSSCNGFYKKEYC